MEINAVVRDPGSRAKVAVSSNDRDIDPVGACVGMRGARVQNVVSELRGEKIDIIPWSEDIARFACNALSPAQVSKVFVDEDNRTLEIIVADDQLSLAIGKRAVARRQSCGTPDRLPDRHQERIQGCRGGTSGILFLRWHRRGAEEAPEADTEETVETEASESAAIETPKDKQAE